MSMIHRLAIAAILLLAPFSLAQLSAGDVVLVVNKNQPAGRLLAEHYAAVRGLDADRIIELDCPDRFSIDFPTYQEKILAPLRVELAVKQLESTAKCVVLFYGMPYRIDGQGPSDADKQEISQINFFLVQARQGLKSAVEELEAVAKSVDSGFKPSSDSSTGGMAARIRSATRAIEQVGAKLSAADRRRFEDAKRTLQSPATIREWPVPLPDGADPAVLNELAARRDDPAARDRLRRIIHAKGSRLALVQLLESQKLELSSDQTEASVDSELACMWWPADYSRRMWQDNPFARGDSSKSIMMIARLDAPSPEIVMRMIDDSIHAERNGLAGKIVFDARGLGRDPRQQVDGFGAFDRTIRAAATRVKSLGFDVVLDDNDALLPAGSVKDAAVYYGWYSLRNYTPSCSFSRGAIAIHVASLELNWMRSDIDKGWCRALLLDGAAATIGAVGEPYLGAFPRADVFVPRLLAGETLGDAYWQSVPMVSWKMSLLGDPLYRPFARGEKRN